jgi:hypothetical protein
MREEVVKYKARIVAKGFTQEYGINYFDTYSPVADISQDIADCADNRGLGTVSNECRDCFSQWNIEGRHLHGFSRCLQEAKQEVNRTKACQVTLGD